MKFFKLPIHILALFVVALFLAPAHVDAKSPAVVVPPAEATHSEPAAAADAVKEEAAPAVSEATEAPAEAAALDDQGRPVVNGEVQHLPTAKQTHMVTPESPVMERIHHFHNQLLVLITVISLFVLALMIYVCVKFSEKANPVPSKVTHNNTIEVIWTLVPALILIVVGWISWHHLYYFDDGRNDAKMTIKVIGYQWYWNYEYPDNGGFSFDSYMIKDEDEPKPVPYYRLLSADNAIVVPVNTKVRVQVTGGDVIHAFAMPPFGVKIDAVPGQLNETWFEANETGMYYGQCSELCGVGHGFMPINIRVVSEADFAAWVEQAKVKFAANGGKPLTYAEVNN